MGFGQKKATFKMPAGIKAYMKTAELQPPKEKYPEMPEDDNERRSLAIIFDRDGREVVVIDEEYKLHIDPALSEKNAALKFFEFLAALMPPHESNLMKCRAALVYCIEALKAGENINNEQQMNEAEKLWYEALKKAEDCFK